MPWLVDEMEAFLGPGNRREGVMETAVPGLFLFQSATAQTTRHVVYRPVICAVIQGVKRVRLGVSEQECGEGEFLAVRFDAVRRLFMLVHQPRIAPILAPGIHREIAYQLLSGPRGRDFLRFSFPSSQTSLLSGAVSEIQRDLARPLHVPKLAASIGMSSSLFHQRFKELTSFSPIQYQKRMRLLEARRLMLSEGMQAAAAAFRVGYQSPSQFSREYARLFGVPPRKDMVDTRLPSQPRQHPPLAIR